MSQIEVKEFFKKFEFNKRSGSSIFSKTLKQELIAVNKIDFSIEKGETVAFVGPNGAGKSTTIKMLTGILCPTSGHAYVSGFEPWTDRQKLAFKIGTVFGQRSQLSFHLPAKDSFKLFSKIYEVDEDLFKNRLSELTELFHLQDIVDQPLRKLSLGQRMRCEVVASLLHNPEIIFLDEPTIGLDVIAKRELRDVLKNLNEKNGTTIFLTSHDTSDIEALCKRTMIISEGNMIYDGPTKSLKQDYIKQKEIYIRFQEPTDLEEIEGITFVKKQPSEIIVRLDSNKLSVKKFLDNVVSKYNIVDINIEDPSLEEIIASFYVKKS